MIHIVHFRPNPGGIELLMPKIIRALQQYQFQVFVIRPAYKDKPDVYTNQDDIVVNYGSDNIFLAYVRLFLYALKHRDDIFHLHNAGPFVLLLLRFTGIKKIVYSIRGTKYWKKPWQKGMRKFSWRLGLGKKVRIIANSEFSRSVFLKEVSNRYPVQVVYNPIYNSDQLSSKPKNSPDKEIRIIYAGRLVKGKNLHKWLDMAAAIKKVIRNARFEIYGDGPLRNELMAYSEKLKLNSLVDFMGFTKDISSAYSQADLMIFLSEYESFGNVVVECVLSGTPVIASAIPSMKEIFRNFPDFLVELDDNLEENVLKKVEKLDQLKTKLPELMEEFKARFSMKKHIQKLDTIYNSFNHKA